MKLRNKKTGVVIETARSSAVTKDKFRIYDEITEKYYTYGSLAELNEEWEDAPEEPKEYWYIDIDGERNSGDMEDGTVKAMKEIGNYFETKEEAELALRKLKAWKRLKDSKIKFCLDFVMNKIVFTYVIGKNTTVDAVDAERQIFEDMKIVFGGEE